MPRRDDTPDYPHATNTYHGPSVAETKRQAESLNEVLETRTTGLPRDHDSAAFSA